jgi:hypothetical protein
VPIVIAVIFCDFVLIFAFNEYACDLIHRIND